MDGLQPWLGLSLTRLGQRPNCFEYPRDRNQSLDGIGGAVLLDAASTKAGRFVRHQGFEPRDVLSTRKPSGCPEVRIDLALGRRVYLLDAQSGAAAQEQDTSRDEEAELAVQKLFRILSPFQHAWGVAFAVSSHLWEGEVSGVVFSYVP